MPAHFPKVLISYSHDSEEHAGSVLELAQKLRIAGVNVVIDQFEPAPNIGWPRWMIKQFKSADIVLTVWTETYSRRIRGEEKPGTGLGATWEGTLIHQELYEGQGVNDKYIPLTPPNGDPQFIEILLRSFTHFNPWTKQGFENLHRHLANQPKVKPAQIGDMHQWDEDGGQPSPAPSSREQQLGWVPNLGKLVGQKTSTAFNFGATPPNRLQEEQPAARPIWQGMDHDVQAQRNLEIINAEERLKAARFQGWDDDIVEALRQRVLVLKRIRRTRKLTLEKGERLSERYLLVSVLGRGGFARVWKALDEETGACVAIKMLHPDLLSDQSRCDRFLRGAREMARLNHLHVVKILVPKATHGDLLYYVMELLPGGTLQERVKQGMDLKIAIEAVLQITSALEMAHKYGQVHRDVKPNNILFHKNGTACLSDFDLVKQEDTTGMTRTGFLGAYIYAAPEAMEAAKNADLRVDVFGLGMSTLFCAYGKDLPASVHRRLEDFVGKLKVSDGLKAAILKATAWEKEDRFQTMAEFAEALRACLRVSLEDKLWNLPDLHIPKAGEIRVYPIGKLNMEVVWVPQGSFLMGSEDNDREKPIHKVSISQGYWLGRFPITNEQYGQFLIARPNHQKPSEWNNERFNADKNPVVGVSWEDGKAFCKWAGTALPTEAQWEYAARGPENRKYPWGNKAPNEKLANFDENVGQTTPVGQYPSGASWVEAQDMAGNVYEWTHDWYDSDYYKTSPTIDPRGPSGGSGRVLRGGSWGIDAGDLRGANRDWDRPGFRYSSIGFRVVLPLGHE